MQNITIVGAGPCGCLLAIYLAQRGYSIDIYEKRLDIRTLSKHQGRSINLALSERGLRALEKAGIREKVLKQSVPIKGRKVHVLEKENQPIHYIYGRNSQEVNYSISRSVLNLEILNAASQYPNINFHFNHKIEEVDLKNSLLHFVDDHQRQQFVPIDHLIAADGANSAIRQSLQQNNQVDFTVEHLTHGYKEILLPAKNSQSLESNFLHIWPCKEFMLMALANLDNSFTMTLFMPLKGELALENLKETTAINQFFEKYFPEIIALYPNIIEEFQQTPISTLTTVQGGPWYVSNKVLLIGDAAHAIVPFFGQGINCGFEDCRLFDEFLDIDSMSEDLFERFYESRKIDTDAILSMAAQNYDEMKHHVGEKDFIFIDHIEKELMHRFPNQYISRYILVSYTHYPYNLVQKIGEMQKQLVYKIYQHFSKSKIIDWNQADPWIHELFNQLLLIKKEG